MTGDLEDVRVDARRVAARLGVTPRHLSRLVTQGRFPAPHYVDGLRRWWASQVTQWEAEVTTAALPAARRRGVLASAAAGIRRLGAEEP